MIVLPANIPRDARLAALGKQLAALPLDKAWSVDVKEWKPKRSDAQNRYLNGVCYKIISEAIGYERDEVSEFLCGTFWGWKDKRVPKKPSNPTGIESIPLRTTTVNEAGKRSVLSKLEFSDFVSFVQRFAASKGLFIPDPDPDHAIGKEDAT